VCWLAAVELAVPLIGLLGTVVGGLLTVLANLLNERARARREREAADAQAARERLRAGRLVEAELRDAAEAIAQATRVGRYWLDGGGRLATPAWQQHAGLLAGSLPASEWAAVANAQTALHGVRLIVADRSAHAAPGQRAPVDERDGLDAVLDALNRALEVLAVDGREDSGPPTDNSR
jgi:hypothetical protein